MRKQYILTEEEVTAAIKKNERAAYSISDVQRCGR